MFNEFSFLDTSKAKTTADCWASFWQDNRTLFTPMSCCWGIRAISGHHHHRFSSVTLNMEFSRQDYWSGLPFPFPGDLPNPETEPESPASQDNPLPSEPPGKPNKVQYRPNLVGKQKVPADQSEPRGCQFSASVLYGKQSWLLAHIFCKSRIAF